MQGLSVRGGLDSFLICLHGRDWCHLVRVPGQVEKDGSSVQADFVAHPELDKNPRYSYQQVAKNFRVLSRGH